MSELHDMMNQPRGPGYTLDGKPTRWADYYTTHPAHSSPPYQDAPEAAETPAPSDGAKLEVHADKSTGIVVRGCCLVVACAAVLILAGCAMSFPVTEMLPVSSPEAPQSILGTAGQERLILASPTAGELAVRQPTALPTTDNSAILAQLAAAQALAAKLQTDLVAANNHNAEIMLDIEKAKAENSKYIAANSAHLSDKTKADTALAAENNKTLELLNEEKRLQNEAADIELQKSAERTAQVSLLILAGIVLAGTWLLFRVVTRPHVSQAAPVEQKRDYPGTAFHPVIPVGTSLVRRETPPGWTDEEMALFALNVRTSRNKTGIPFTRGWWVDKNGMPDKRWDSLNVYLFEHDYILAATDAANSTASFTPDGERYLTLFESGPLSPAQENPISADLSSDSPPR